MALEQTRRFFAEEIRAVAGLQSVALVEALGTVPREDFLGMGPWQIATTDPRRPGKVIYRQTPDADPSHVYHNVLIAIDALRELNNGHPATLASCLDTLDLKRGESFLHVGCGVGYYTALGATVVGSAGTVHAVEIDSVLAERATQCLRDWPHVTVTAGDGAAVDLIAYDAILVNAGFTHPLDQWLDALNDGGRLLLPITAGIPGSPISSGAMFLIARRGNAFHAEARMPIAIFASPSGRDAGLDERIRQAFGTGRWHTVRSLRRDVHELSSSCCIHGTRTCFSAEPANR